MKEFITFKNIKEFLIFFFPYSFIRFLFINSISLSINPSLYKSLFVICSVFVLFFAFLFLSFSTTSFQPLLFTFTLKEFLSFFLITFLKKCLLFIVFCSFFFVFFWHFFISFSLFLNLFRVCLSYFFLSFFFLTSLISSFRSFLFFFLFFFHLSSLRH